MTAIFGDIHQIVRTPTSTFLHYLVSHHFGVFPFGVFGIIHNNIALYGIFFLELSYTTKRGVSSERTTTCVTGCPTPCSLQWHLLCGVWTHLFTVHGIQGTGRRTPFAFRLLPGKTQTLYTNLLQQLDNYGPFYPDTILLDYEKGLQNARCGTRPLSAAATSKKCLCKYFAQSKLVPEYQVPGSDVRKEFYMIAALPFVPIDDVDRAWRFLKFTLSSDVNTFARYFESTWIGQSSSSSSGPGISMKPAKLGSPTHLTSLEVGHPMVWKFLDALRLEQALTDIKITINQSHHKEDARATLAEMCQT